MAVIETGLSTAGLRAEFFERLRETQSVFMDLATRIASTKETENYKWLGTVPQMREWGTGRLAKGIRSESYDVANLKYEATLEVDQDEIDDDQTGQIRIRVGELARRAATHKDKMIADLLANGESAGFNSYDGVSFFHAAHVSGSSGSQSNKLDVDISAVTPAEPNTIDDPSPRTLQVAFGQAVAAMQLFKDDQGEPLDLPATGLVVVCHPQVQASWFMALQSAILANTSNVFQRFNARIVPFGRLTDISKFYVLKTDDGVRPFVFQDRRPIQFDAIAEGSEEAFKREKHYYGVSARYRMTYGDWMKAIRVDLT